MEKKIILAVLLIFLYSCASDELAINLPTEHLPEVPVSENIIQESTVTEIAEADENSKLNVITPSIITPSTPPEMEPAVGLFPSQLTYPNAYNGPLYATSEQIGDSAPFSHLQNLRRNGVNFMIAFFSIELDPGEEVDSDIEYAKQVVRSAPGRVIPFLSLGLPAEETKPLVGERLATRYRETLTAVQQQAGENFIRGIGEIEQYAWDIQPNDPKMLELFDLAAENDLMVMFHPDPGQSNGVKTVIERYPDTIFLIHMFPEDLSADRQQYINLLEAHDNVYFSVDADHMMFDGETGLLYKYEDESVAQAKVHFLADYDRNEQQLLNSALGRYKPLIEAVPDKVMWGTEGGTEYFYEPEVYDRTVKFSRLFIAKLDPAVQEKFAYKNAQRLLPER